MIRYIGGKSRFAKQIVEVLKQYSINRERYVEPFFGGGSLSKYTKELNLPRHCSDYNRNLIILYQQIQLGWIPPETVSEEEYTLAKNSLDCTMKTYIGYACSYGGKYFGGYARDKSGKRDLTRESYNRVMKEKDSISDIVFDASDYKNLVIKSTDLIYSDPPYANTLGYGDSFNSEEFWDYMRKWSKIGAKVIISEYVAPEDFTCIWEHSYSTNIHHEVTNNKKIERLFIYNG